MLTKVLMLYHLELRTLTAEQLCNSVFGISLLRDEDCYPSPSRWSECIGCRQMRVVHILRAASAGGTACPPSIFETRSCVSSEGCQVSVVSFPVPPDQPSSGEEDSTEENTLMRPIGGIFLVAAVGCVLLLLAGLESWRRWGTSTSAYREVLNIQRQRDLISARQQMMEYKKMIQEYKDQLEEEDWGSETGALVDSGGQGGSFFLQNDVAAPAAGREEPRDASSIHSSEASEPLKTQSGSGIQSSESGSEAKEEGASMEGCEPS